MIKNNSVLDRTFYLRCRFDQIGLDLIDKNKCLTKLEKCLEAMPDHPAIQESLARVLVEIYINDTESIEYQRAKKLFSLAAYSGHKAAIRHLATTSTMTNFEQSVTGMFSHLGLDQEDDPFYDLFLQGQIMKNGALNLKDVFRSLFKYKEKTKETLHVENKIYDFIHIMIINHD